MAKKSASSNAQSARQAAGSNNSARSSSRKAAPASSGRKNAARSERRPTKAAPAAANAVVDHDTADLVRDLPPGGSGRHRENDSALAAKAKTAKIGVDTQIINKIVLRAHDLKSAHPKIAAEIDWNEWEIRKCMETIRTSIDQLPEENRELVTVLVINGIHRMCDDILIAQDVKALADEAEESDEP